MRFTVSDADLNRVFSEIITEQKEKAKTGLEDMGNDLFFEARGNVPVWTGELRESGRAYWETDKIFEVSFGSSWPNPKTGVPTEDYAEEVETTRAQRAIRQEDGTLLWYTTHVGGYYYMQMALEAILRNWHDYFTEMPATFSETPDYDIQEGDVPY